MPDRIPEIELLRETSELAPAPVILQVMNTFATRDPPLAAAGTAATAGAATAAGSEGDAVWKIDNVKLCRRIAISILRGNASSVRVLFVFVCICVLCASC